MPKLPRLRGKELIRSLAKLGFVVIQVRGSHHFLQNPDGRRTVVPVHAGEVIGSGLLAKILKDAEIGVDDL